MLAVVARDGAEGRFRLDRLVVRTHQHRRHQTQRAVALGHDVRLLVAVVVFARPEEATGRLEHLRHHVVDQTAFVPDALPVELRLVVLLEDLFEDVLEPAVVALHDGVLGGHVKRPLLL